MRKESLGQIQFYRTGAVDGAKVIAVHGFADEGRTFETLADTQLTQDFELIMPDLPGFGASPARLDGQADIGTLADSILALVDAVSPHRPVYLMGHSIGSAIAVAAAIKRPDAVAHVLSIEGNLTPSDAYFTGQAVNYDDPKQFKQIFLDKLSELTQAQPELVRYIAAVKKADPNSMWTLGCSAFENGKRNGFGKALVSLQSLGVGATYVWGRDNFKEETHHFVTDRLTAGHVAVHEFKSGTHWYMIDAPQETARIAVQAFSQGN